MLKDEISAVANHVKTRISYTSSTASSSTSIHSLLLPLLLLRVHSFERIRSTYYELHYKSSGITTSTTTTAAGGVLFKICKFDFFAVGFLVCCILVRHELLKELDNISGVVDIIWCIGRLLANDTGICCCV